MTHEPTERERKLLDALRGETFSRGNARKVLSDAVETAALNRLAEMRLIATHNTPEGLGIVGITKRGKDVLIGLLYVASGGFRFEPAMFDEFVGLAIKVAQLIPYEDMTPAARAIAAEFVEEEIRNGAPGGGTGD